MLRQEITAFFAEHFFLPIQFIERVRFEHNTFAVDAVVEAKQMTDFVGTLFCYPVDEIVIIRDPSVIFITEPCS